MPTFTGEQYDPDLNLYYLRARYFNPLTGRFLTRDPDIGKIRTPATLHKYVHAGAADPVNAIDPSGRNSIIEYLLNLTVLQLTAIDVIALSIREVFFCTRDDFEGDNATPPSRGGAGLSPTPFYKRCLVHIEKEPAIGPTSVIRIAESRHAHRTSGCH
jgi:RHS repeat-associated protein